MEDPEKIREHTSRLCIWTPPFTQQSIDQNKNAYVYSAFWWRRYLLALNVCAPRHLYESAALLATNRDRLNPGG